MMENETEGRRIAGRSKMEDETDEVRCPTKLEEGLLQDEVRWRTRRIVGRGKMAEKGVLQNVVRWRTRLEKGVLQNVGR